MNRLFFGDNLGWLRDKKEFPDESVDLVYLDPPFNSNADYNLLFKSPKGQEREALTTAFEDSWHWGEQAKREFNELVHSPNTAVSSARTKSINYMAKNKNSAGEQSSSPKDENSNGEIERRLAALEKSTADLNNRIFDSHKWFVTIPFSAVAVVLTVYGVMSRLDVKDSTAAMEKRVESKTIEMQAKVQALVGEALKKPVLEVMTADDQPLEWG